MIMHRHFETKTKEKIDVQLSSSKPGILYLVIDGEPVPLHWSDAGRLASILGELAQNAKYAESH